MYAAKMARVITTSRAVGAIDEACVSSKISRTDRSTNASRHIDTANQRAETRDMTAE